MASTKRAPKPKGEKVLRPVLASAAIEAAYRKKILALVDEMAGSAQYWISAAYRKNEPEVAQLASDESPAAALLRTIRGLKKRWFKRFDDGAKKLAEYFATAVSQRSDATLRRILKDAGFMIDWRMTPAQRDIIQASIGENVALIKSIPRQYFDRIEGMVMRSVQVGGDLKQLTDELQKSFGVTRRRAALIARDQNMKANGALTRARYLELGIDEAIWVHSAGGREPRPTHVAAGRERARYKISEGWHDPDPKVNRKIIPGELINCRCVARPVLQNVAPR